MQPEPPLTAPSGHPAGERLESWKEIAAYLKRDVRTVQRWEKHEQLPVYRHGHGKLSTVYAYEGEIEAWLNSRHPAPGPVVRVVPGRRTWLAAAGLAVAAAAIWMGARYWFHRAPASLDIVARRVWLGPDAAWLGAVAPDGSTLSYMEPESRNLMLREIAGGRERRLATGVTASPVFSPDSQRVAYAWLNRDLIYELHLIGITGSGERRLYSNPAWPSVKPMDWSADGRHILALLRSLDRRGQIVLINSDDGAVHVLQTLDWRVPLRVSLSPDSAWVAFDFPAGADSGSRNLYLLDVAAPPNSAHPIPLVEHSGGNILLGWSPDGRMILFASDRTGAADGWILRMRQGRAQGPPELVKKDLGMVWPLGFTRQNVFLYARQTPLTDVYLASMDAKTGRVQAPVVLAAEASVGTASSPDWAAGGKYLAYLTRQSAVDRGPVATIVVRDLETHQERAVHPALHFLQHIRWSADGQSFLAGGIDLEGRQGLFRLDAATGAAAPLAPGTLRTSVPEFAQTPGGLVYTLRDWDLEPGRLEAGGVPLGRAGHFALSVDGRRLAFSTADDSWQYLKLAPATGGPVREIYREPRAAGRITSLAWTPDGNQIWFARHGELWRVAAAGGRPEKLSLAMPGLAELRISPDATRLAFTAGKGTGEVWEMQHFLPR